MKIPARDLATASFLSSVLLFFLAVFLGSFMVRTAQPNGLAQIETPDAIFGLYALIASAGLFLSGIASSYASLKAVHCKGDNCWDPHYCLVAWLQFWLQVFVYLADWQDEGPRCFNGCAASLLSYYNEVYLSKMITIVLGFVLAFLGAVLLKRKDDLVKNLHEMQDMVLGWQNLEARFRSRGLDLTCLFTNARQVSHRWAKAKNHLST